MRWQCCLQVKESVDIFMSHDWPTHITQYGDAAALFQKKPYFRAEADRHDLGSPASWQLLQARVAIILLSCTATA